MAHTYSYEFCNDCDMGYRSYSCMMAAPSDDRLIEILKDQYEIGQQDPRPFNPKAQDVKDAVKALKEWKNG